jgi:hypothetical protein
MDTNTIKKYIDHDKDKKVMIEVQDITFYEACKCPTYYTILPKDEGIGRQR